MAYFDKTAGEKPMTQISEAERIVRLMLLIRENGPIDLAGIRRALPYEYGKAAGSEDSTRRRFERDKKTLQDSGVFLTVDDRQRYVLDAARTLAAPLVLTKPQVSLMRLLCGALLDDEDYPFKEELRMVLVKLGDELEIPDMLPQLADGLSRGLRDVYKRQATQSTGICQGQEGHHDAQAPQFRIHEHCGDTIAAHGRTPGVLLSKRFLLRCRI